MTADAMSRTFRALADPGRRAMVDQLSRGPATVSQLGRPMRMSLAAVLQHVQVLEASGLVTTRKIGRARTCTLAPAPMRAAEEWFSAHRAIWERRLDRLGAVLEAEDDPAVTGDPR